MFGNFRIRLTNARRFDDNQIELSGFTNIDRILNMATQVEDTEQPKKQKGKK